MNSRAPGGPAVAPAAPARWFLLLLFAATWGAYLAYYLATPRLGQPPIYSITGDEPHYLVVATSLVRDRDLDVYNNYRDKHYLPFYPHHLGDPRDLEDMHALYGRDGRVYSKHALGLPLLIAPVLAWGGHVAVQVGLITLAALLGVQLFLLGLDLTGRAGPALGAWALGAATSPLLLYADQVYPELPAALLVLWAVRALLPASGCTRWAALTVGVACAALPWLHPRYLPLAAALAAAVVMVERRRLGRALRWAAPAPLLASAALWAYYVALFGGVPPLEEYGSVALSHLPSGALGLLLDQQYGLLAYSPALVTGLYGLTLLIVRRPPRWWLLPLVVLPYFLIVASFSWWFGAWSPPGRMLVPVVPLVGGAAAVALASWRGTGFRLFGAATAVASYLVAWQLLAVPHLRYNLWDGHAQLLLYLSKLWGVDLVPLWPSFIRPTLAGYVWAACAAVVLAALGLWFSGRAPWQLLRARQRRFPGPALAVDSLTERPPGAAAQWGGRPGTPAASPAARRG